jgi:hypothetical protein
MPTLKKIFRSFSSFGFKVLIMALAIVGAMVFTFHSPDKIQKSLSDSGVYDTFVDNALAELNKTLKKNPEAQNVPTENPAVIAAAKNAFSPELLQNSTESLLDGIYSWLSGKTKVPDYSIDLTQAKQTFAEGIGSAAAARMSSLPPCSRAQLSQVNIDELDPFNAPCLPPGTNITEQQAKLIDELKNSKDFLGTTKLTADSLPKDENGKTVFDNLSKLPSAYINLCGCGTASVRV